jgi:hypothetical protein
MVTFARHEDGIGVWKDGKLVAVIPRDNLHELLYLAALELRGR